MSLSSIPSSSASDALRNPRTNVDSAGSQFGQDQFLTLMLAQLRNQDPLKPLEPSEFLGQLAQFSTVTGIQDMKGSVGELAGSLRSSQVLEGATLVGRSVLAAGTGARLDSGGAVLGAVEAPDGASSIEVTVRDAAGAIVRQFAVEPQAGLTPIRWDGLAANGDRAANGAYRLDAVGRFGGRAESLEMLIQQRVDSVTIDPAGGDMTLNTASGALGLADIRRVM
jgi:flagellar basal-body rod modification protein FlgD